MGTVSVIIPTRGTVFARCIRSVMENLDSCALPHKIIFHSGDPIPDCFNIPIAQERLTRDPDYIWIVEEDIEVPAVGLYQLMQAQSDIAAIDYPFPNGYGCAAYYKGKPMWVGTGCTLIKRRVLDEIPQPWFRTDIHYLIDGKGFFREHEAKASGYGGHDIRFCLVAKKTGFSIDVVPSITAKHYKIEAPGKAGDNNGVHTITCYDHITKPHVLRQNPLTSVST